MLVEMFVSRITLDPFTNMPIVILKDKGGDKALPIWIGLLEASAIATQLENIELSRPMTHDLLKNILAELGAKVDKISVVDLRDNTFFATIEIISNGKKHMIDSRPSDAMALALRMGAPIYVDEKIIEKSKKIDLGMPETLPSADEKEKWEEILRNLPPEHFGKYKM